MRILFIGDIVGSPGRLAIEENIVKLKEKYHPHIIIANGENAAGGRGINEKIVKQFFQWGINVITLGNHTWDQKAIFDFIDDYKNLIRPANFPEGTPGNGYTMIHFNNFKLAVINLQGRTYLPPLECPFKTVDMLIEKIKKETVNIIVDFHAEATSEKQALAWYLDGRVSAVIGTHTHVQTGDERILPNGTAYITDVGMVGPYDGILGMKKEAVIDKFLTQLPNRFEVDKSSKWQLNSVIIDINLVTGKAEKIERIRIDPDHPLW
ncbi:metallophosphoesterase [Vulcanibacillus modesticaldus]|uniref:Metallophosphoesterase n=1 Tax=Vulcanibacillus modesticaldus TaxID=337097 RepID=A0A1D2YXW8_9BACI|nr:TIGR00282 family metallophosphoesterase [Vulcanibacillus modesticaldus]OEG00477.1 metallophosphoesterase [Vulcanibacillus modesticaldus]